MASPTSGRSRPAGRWTHPPAGDVALMAHVGYDIERIGPFLDALEAAAPCRVALLMEQQPAMAAAPFWAVVYGEPRIPLPALPEFLDAAPGPRRRADRRSPARDPGPLRPFDEMLGFLRRQTWVAPGGARIASWSRRPGRRPSKHPRAGASWPSRRSWASSRGAAGTARPAATARVARRTAGRLCSTPAGDPVEPGTAGREVAMSDARRRTPRIPCGSRVVWHAPPRRPCRHPSARWTEDGPR